MWVRNMQTIYYNAKQIMKITQDWMGDLYCGIKLDWDYNAQTSLSHLLAMRNTVLGKSTRVGADNQNVTAN